MLQTTTNMQKTNDFDLIAIKAVLQGRFNNVHDLAIGNIKKAALKGTQYVANIEFKGLELSIGVYKQRMQGYGDYVRFVVVGNQALYTF